MSLNNADFPLARYLLGLSGLCEVNSHLCEVDSHY